MVATLPGFEYIKLSWMCFLVRCLEKVNKYSPQMVVFHGENYHDTKVQIHQLNQSKLLKLRQTFGVFWRFFSEELRLRVALLKLPNGWLRYTMAAVDLVGFGSIESLFG